MKNSTMKMLIWEPLHSKWGSKTNSLAEKIMVITGRKKKKIKTKKWNDPTTSETMPSVTYREGGRRNKKGKYWGVKKINK